jgi:hypothetical protein
MTEFVCANCQEENMQGKTGKVAYRGLDGYDPNKWVYRKPVADDSFGRFSHGICPMHYEKMMRMLDNDGL